MMDAIDSIDQRKFVVRASAKSGLDSQPLRTSNMIHKRKSQQKKQIVHDFNYEAPSKPQQLRVKSLHNSISKEFPKRKVYSSYSGTNAQSLANQAVKDSQIMHFIQNQTDEQQQIDRLSYQQKGFHGALVAVSTKGGFKAGKASSRRRQKDTIRQAEGANNSNSPRPRLLENDNNLSKFHMTGFPGEGVRKDKRDSNKKMIQNTFLVTDENVENSMQSTQRSQPMMTQGKRKENTSQEHRDDNTGTVKNSVEGSLTKEEDYPMVSVDDGRLKNQSSRI